MVKQTVQVTALPLDLPHDIQIDISVIEHEGQVLHISDLKVSDKVRIDEDLEAPVLTTLLNATEEEETVVTPEEEVKKDTDDDAAKNGEK